MSGHSKWHNIQKTKGAADAKRSAAFTKIAKEIIVAVKQGGSGDPNNNSRLATVIAKAKAANMPNDNIKRTIDKALGSGNTDNYESVTYEGYGPGGVAVIVEALTDNRQRTAPEVRHYFDKYGKGMGAQGCVSWSFDRKGVIIIDNEDGDYDEDTVMMDALDAGAADFQPEEGCFTVYTDPADFNDVAKALEEPIRQIAANAGIDGSVVLEKVRSAGKNGYGFDAYKEEYCDMIASGIVDPAKVTRSALENAASVSGMVLTTESLVADKPQPPAPAAPAPEMGGMGGMY